MKDPTPTTLVATCAGGLESVLADEIRDAGWIVRFEEAGAVRFAGDERQTGADVIAAANLRLRTASRILLPLARGSVRSYDELYELAARIRWATSIPVTHSFSVTAVTRDAKLSDHRFAALRVKDAVVDAQRRATRQRSSVDRKRPDVPVVAFVADGSAEISLDTSGAPLHERGYRREAGEAPLRETLAAGLLLLAGFGPDTFLLDPFCGSGTITIEAALLARGTAPGLLRDDFAFLHWPGADRKAFDTLRESLLARRREKAHTPIIGRDSDDAVVRVAERNAQRAGVVDQVDLGVADFFSAASPQLSGQKPGVIVTNPPFGERMELGDAAAFYRRIGDTLKRHYAGWTAWILSANSRAMKQLGLRVSARLPVFNGGLESRLYRVDLYR